MARPTAYREEYDEQAFKLCLLLGATDAELADFFGVSETTVNNWKKAHPSFLESLKAGKDQADSGVAGRLYRRAMGYEHEAVKIAVDPKGDHTVVPYTKHYPPDTTACIFWLKNRQPARWRDRHEVTGADGGPIKTESVDVTKLSTETLLKIREELGDGVD